MAVTQAQHLHILPLVLLMDLQDLHRIILQVQYAAVKVPWLADLKKNKLTNSFKPHSLVQCTSLVNAH